MSDVIYSFIASKQLALKGEQNEDEIWKRSISYNLHKSSEIGTIISPIFQVKN